MSKEAIVERILSDARSEAEELLAEAKASAADMEAAAERRAEEELEETRRDTEERVRKIKEGRAATARLDSAKLLLGEKRRVLDGVYARALEKLEALGERETLALTERLLSRYAERGDTVIFAENYPFAEKAAALPVFKEKALVLSEERARVGGGFLLSGKLSDRDLSYASLLEADREEHQAQLAERIFQVK